MYGSHPSQKTMTRDIHAAAAAELTTLLKEMQGVKPNYKEPTVPKPHVKKPVDPSIPRESPVMKYVRNLAGGPFFTAIEVANQVGVSVQAVRKYAKNPELKAPSHFAPFGRLKIYLYTKEDVQEIQDYLAGRNKVQTNDKG